MKNKGKIRGGVQDQCFGESEGIWLILRDPFQEKVEMALYIAG